MDMQMIPLNDFLEHLNDDDDFFQRYDDCCSLITRLDEHEMRGMRRVDAGNYLNMVADRENLILIYI